MQDNNGPVYLTAEGMRKLQEELDYLCNVRRPEVAQQIHDAKAEGDISENAGYDEAKNEQAFLEGRILTVQAMLHRAELIQNGSSECVTLGSNVTVCEVGTEDLETYLIVGSAEAAPASGRISNVSPLGVALMDKCVGDEVVAKTPGGELRFQVVSINDGACCSQQEP
jgi:transcription elongation factor GreA